MLESHQLSLLTCFSSPSILWFIADDKCICRNLYDSQNSDKEDGSCPPGVYCLIGKPKPEGAGVQQNRSCSTEEAA